MKYLSKIPEKILKGLGKLERIAVGVVGTGVVLVTAPYVVGKVCKDILRDNGGYK